MRATLSPHELINRRWPNEPTVDVPEPCERHRMSDTPSLEHSAEPQPEAVDGAPEMAVYVELGLGECFPQLPCRKPVLYRLKPRLIRRFDLEVRPDVAVRSGQDQMPLGPKEIADQRQKRSVILRVFDDLGRGHDIELIVHAESASWHEPECG